MYKNSKCNNDKFTEGNSVVFRFLNVITGFIPVILVQQVTNLVNKFAVLFKRSMLNQDCRNASGNDGCRGRGLIVCYQFFKQMYHPGSSANELPLKAKDDESGCWLKCWGRWLSVCCNAFKYPSPEANASTSPAGGEVLNSVCNASALNVILRRERSELSGESRNITSLLLKRMYHPGSSANELTLKAKDDNKSVLQYGRSMIEMLGVLAIIAVLSVGGIAGYSKAMEMYRVNKIIQDYNMLVFGLLEYRQSFQKNTVSERTMTDTVMALNLVPNTWTKLNEAYLEDSYGNWLNIRYRQTNNNYGSFEKEGMIIDFNFGGLNIDDAGNKSSDNFNDKICFEMFKNIIQPLHNTLTGAMMVGGSGYFYGDTYCKANLRCLSNLTLAQMKETCDSCNKSKRCNVTIIF